MTALMSCNQKVYMQGHDGIFILNDVRSITYYSLNEGDFNKRTQNLKPFHYDSFGTNGNIVLSKNMLIAQLNITAIKSYSEEGHLIQKITKTQLGTRNTDQWKYDNDGRVCLYLSMDKNGDTTSVVTTHYQRKGDTLTTIKKSFGRNGTPNSWKTVEIEEKISRREKLLTSLHYDGSNQLKRTSYLRSTYFFNGRLHQLNEWNKNTLDSSATIFNPSGFCIENYSRSQLYTDSFWVTNLHYKNDKNGNWIELWDDEYEMDSFKTHFKYQFDSRGNWIEQIRMEENGDTSRVTRRKISYY